jgi:hypothetical protein
MTPRELLFKKRRSSRDTVVGLPPKPQNCVRIKIPVAGVVNIVEPPPVLVALTILPVRPPFFTV